MTARQVLIYVRAELRVFWTLVPIFWLLNMSLMFKTELRAVPTPL